MNILTGASALIVAGVAMTAAGAASATVYNITYTGTVASGGIDGDGVFGPAGGDIGGDAFTATYVYNDSLGAVFSDADGAGRVAFKTPDIFQSARLRINGFTKSFATDLVNVQVSGTSAPYLLSEAVTHEEALDLKIGLASYAPNPLAPFSAVGVPADESAFYFDNYVDHGIITGADHGILSATSVDVRVAGVPEPGAWALMLVGLGGLGAALRWKRKVVAVAA